MTADLCYLTTDSAQSGVGTSQVTPYVLRLAALGLDVHLHSFEPAPIDPDVRARFTAGGVEWRPHRFGSHGPLGGFGRVLVGAALLPDAAVIHARSDMAAAAVMLRGRQPWVWDVRSFWVDQRIAMGAVRVGSPVERAMRSIERRAARSSSAIVTLTAAAIDELARRHGDHVAAKCTVISTCVDLDRFHLLPMPDGPVRLLLSGTFNSLYDMPTTLRFVERLRARRATELTFLRPAPGPGDEAVLAAGGALGSTPFASMPAEVAGHHAGLSILHGDHPMALVAAMPTKIAEFLACGRPVVVNRGLGDCDELLAPTGTGVVLDGDDAAAIDRAVDQLAELVDDPGTPARCRELAVSRFDVTTATQRLTDLYRSLGPGG